MDPGEIKNGTETHRDSAPPFDRPCRETGKHPAPVPVVVGVMPTTGANGRLETYSAATATSSEFGTSYLDYQHCFGSGEPPSRNMHTARGERRNDRFFTALNAQDSGVEFDEPSCALFGSEHKRSPLCGSAIECFDNRFGKSLRNDCRKDRDDARIRDDTRR